MERKTPIILAIIFILALITACTSENQTVGITQEDIETVRNLTLEDVEEELTFVTQDFVKDHAYLKLVNLQFNQDQLAVDAINEVKKFNNIEMRLEIEVDSDLANIDMEDDLTINDNFSSFASDMERELLDTFVAESPYEFSRVITTDISFRDEGYNLQHNSVSGHIRDSETMITLRNEESEAERLALEKTFDLVGQDKEAYQLSRFGIIDNRLIIHFFQYGTEEEANFTKEELSQELYILAREDQDFANYINHRAQELVIIFNDQSFNYELEF